MVEGSRHRVKWLLLIIILGIGTRLLFLRKEYLWGADPYYHYSNFVTLVESNGLFPLSQYSPAQFLYLFLKLIRFSPYDSFRLTAPLFGILAIVPIYLIARKILDEDTAMFSSFFLAFLPANIDRTIAGNYRGDPFSLFFAIWGFFFFLKGLKKDTKKILIYSSLAGLFFALSGVLWSSAYIFAMVVITGFIVVDVLICYIARHETNILSYLISAGLGIFFLKILVISNAIQIMPLGFDEFSEIIYPSMVFALIILEGLNKGTVHWKTEKRGMLILLLGLSSLLYIATQQNMPAELISVYGKPSRFDVGTSYQFTLELQPMDFGLYWQRFYLIGIFSVLGFISIIKGSYDRNRLFLMIWGISSVYVMYRIGLRGAFTASFPLSVLGSFGMVKMYRFIQNRPNERFPIHHGALVVVLALSANHGITYAHSMEPLINDNWNEALEWIETNTPEDSVVLADWSYGYWIMAIAEREPVLTPGQNQEKIKIFYSILLTNNSRMITNALQKYDVDYIVLGSDVVFYVPQMETIVNESGFSYMIFPHRGGAYLGDDRIPAEVYGDEKVFVVPKNGKYYGYVLEDESLLPVKLSYYEGNTNIVTGGEPEIFGTFFFSNDHLPIINIDNYIIYSPVKSEDTLLTSLLIKRGEGYENLELVYTNPQVKVYQVMQ